MLGLRGKTTMSLEWVDSSRVHPDKQIFDVFNLAVLAYILYLWLELKCVFIFELIVQIGLWQLEELAYGYFLGKVERFVLQPDVLDLVLEVLGHQLPVNTGGRLSDAHLWTCVKVGNFLTVAHEEVAPGEFEIAPYLQVALLEQPGKCEKFHQVLGGFFPF